MTKSSDREEFISQMEERLIQAEKDVRYLMEVNKRIKAIDKNIAVLSEYYTTEWLEDYNHTKTEKLYNVLNQDSIYNAIQEIYLKKIKLLKMIVNKMEG